MGSEVKLGSPVSLHQTGEAEQRQTAASPVRKGFSRVTNTAAVGAECCRVRWGGLGGADEGENAGAERDGPVVWGVALGSSGRETRQTGVRLSDL